MAWNYKHSKDVWSSTVRALGSGKASEEIQGHSLKVSLILPGAAPMPQSDNPGGHYPKQVMLATAMLGRHKTIWKRSDAILDKQHRRKQNSHPNGYFSCSVCERLCASRVSLYPCRKTHMSGHERRLCLPVHQINGRVQHQNNIIWILWPP